MVGHMNILIFYSSIGRGHISAAHGVQKEILRQAPDAKITLKDIREFMPPAWRKLDERLYWFIANNLPDCFESIFRSMQARGNHIPSLAMLPNDYPEDKVHAYINETGPDAIIATHYGSAQVLGNLRERGLLTDIRIGWLHTDYFEGYFPRISMRIDKTFLAHRELEEKWLAAGVAPDRVATSGMPISEDNPSPSSQAEMLNRHGLNPSQPIVMITGGKEGAVDYVAAVKSLCSDFKDPLQVIAACGLNYSQRAALNSLRWHLPGRVTLKVIGLVPHSEILSLMRSCGLLMTKAGGMTPTEAFVTGVPTILLDVVSGHERENARMFRRLGLAEVAENAQQAGIAAAMLLSSPARAGKMLKAQAEFRRNANISAISGFALDEKFTPAVKELEFGLENGKAVRNAKEAIAILNSESPSELELLLSYSTATSPQRIVIENPFGHIAIRVGDTVYSTNHLAAPEVDPNLLQRMALEQYLYGVRRPSRSQVHVSTYGMAYGRATIGFRISGVPAGRVNLMKKEAARIDSQFSHNSLRWDRDNFNCADAVLRILKAGGYHSAPLLDRVGLPTMPLDVFEQARNTFESSPGIKTEFVAYRQLAGSQAKYRFARFPLSIGQPLRSIARIMDTEDPLEGLITKQVSAYPNEPRLRVEYLAARQSASEHGTPAGEEPAPLDLGSAMLSDLQRLLNENTKRSRIKLEQLGNIASLQEAHRFLDHSLLLARLTADKAHTLLCRRDAQRIKRRFQVLAENYKRIDFGKMQKEQMKIYLGHLQAFAAAAITDFSNAAALDARQLNSVPLLLWRKVERLCRRVI